MYVYTNSAYSARDSIYITRSRRSPTRIYIYKSVFPRDVGDNGEREFRLAIHNARPIGKTVENVTPYKCYTLVYSANVERVSEMAIAKQRQRRPGVLYIYVSRTKRRTTDFWTPLTEFYIYGSKAYTYWWVFVRDLSTDISTT